MDAVQAALATRLSTPAGIASGEVPVWNGSTWVRSSVLGLAPSGISGYPSSARKFLRGDGSWNEMSYAKLAGLVTVVNTVTETSVLGGGVVIPGNLLGTTGVIRASIQGFLTNNTGAPQNFTLKIKFGGTTFWGDLVSVATGANQRVVTLDFLLYNYGATNNNLLHGSWFEGDGSLGTVAGYGHTGTLLEFGSGAQTIDTTASQTLDVTVTHGTANANMSYQRFLATFEVL